MSDSLVLSYNSLLATYLGCQYVLLHPGCRNNSAEEAGSKVASVPGGESLHGTEVDQMGVNAELTPHAQWCT